MNFSCSPRFKQTKNLRMAVTHTKVLLFIEKTVFTKQGHLPLPVLLEPKGSKRVPPQHQQDHQIDQQYHQDPPKVVGRLLYFFCFHFFSFPPSALSYFILYGVETFLCHQFSDSAGGLIPGNFQKFEERKSLLQRPSTKGEEKRYSKKWCQRANTTIYGEIKEI